MCKLIHANLYRLRRNNIFWAEIGFTAIFSLFIIIANYSPDIQVTESRLYLDDVFFILYQVLGFILAAGISLIVGTEYSDGTIRNKLIVGRTRTQIYFANLIASAISSCVVLLVHGVITFGVGYFLWGNFQMAPEQAITAFLCALLTTFVYSALFVSISMNCSNKAITAVVSMLLVLGLIYLTAGIGNALMEPEMVYNDVVFSVDSIQFGEEIPNPAYVAGLQRIVYEFIYDFLPTGQLIQMYTLDFTRCARWPIFSVVFLVLMTSVGFLVFRRKDIK